MAITNRSYTSGFSILKLAGADAGVVKSVKGGTIVGEVISGTGPEYYRQKQIVSTHLEPLTIQLDFSMSQAVFDWIAASWVMNNPRRNGAITVCDYNMEARRETAFVDALISEVTIPAIDATDRDFGYLTIKIQPGSIQSRAASGRVKSAGRTQKSPIWSPQNFQLVIDGLDCSTVILGDFTVR